MSDLFAKKGAATDEVNTNHWRDNFEILNKSDTASRYRDMVLKRSRMLEMITDKQSAILDLGCGTGPFLKYFNERGFDNMFAIEPDADLIKKIPTEVKATVRACRAEQIDFASDKFDVVFVYCVLHHLEGIKAYQAACAEIYRVLKPGGLVFIMEPGQWQVFRMVEIASKVLGLVSKTFRVFSECMVEEEVLQHFFIRNHGVVRDALLEAGMHPIIDRYFVYSWIFTARKPK